MNKIYKITIIVFVILNGALIYYALNIKTRLSQTENELYTLCAIKMKPIPDHIKETELRKIYEWTQKDPAPPGLVYNIRIYENGVVGHSYGMLRVFPFHDKDRQLRSCVTLIQQEMSTFVSLPENRDAFVKQLALRYNKQYAEQWSKGILYLWNDFDKINEIKADGKKK